MATNTSKYGFKKPEENDFYSVEDQNRNWDLADNALTKLNSDLTTVAGNFFEVGAILENEQMQTINLPSGLTRPPFLLAAQIQLYEGVWSDISTFTGFPNLACNSNQLAINKDAAGTYAGYWVRFLFKK